MLNEDVKRADHRTELAEYADALDHIARTARASRVTSRRLTWIASRAESALAGNDDWRVSPVPKNGISELMRAKQKLTEAEARAEKAEALLRSCDAACRRVIVQDGGILGGIDFHALHTGITAHLQEQEKERG